MDSSLSSVPPLCPRPRPLIMGTFRPPAATMGAMTSEVLSPTPPVECLSTFRPARSEKSSTRPECSMASVSAAISGPAHTAKHDRHQPGRHLVIGNVAAGVRGNELFDFFAGKFARVSLAADQVNGAHALGGSIRSCHGEAPEAPWSSSRWVISAGQRSLHGRTIVPMPRLT